MLAQLPAAQLIATIRSIATPRPTRAQLIATIRSIGTRARSAVSAGTLTS
jgi:hypothetical protein